MRKNRLIALACCQLVVLTLAGAAASAQAETLTYPDLVRRMTDLERLAVAPPAGELGAVVTSYDRKSQYDAAQDKYLGWGANGDGAGFVRKEGDQTVLAELTGPGCIWRSWTAGAGTGHVKIFLDGSLSPAVDLPYSGYFDGKTDPFTRPNLVYTSGRGLNNYTPISFQKSCKIVADLDWGIHTRWGYMGFYQFNYTRFAPGTVVPTFKLPLSAEDAAALDQANAALGKCSEDPSGHRSGEKMESSVVTIPANSKATVAELAGPEAITALRVQLELPSDLDAQRTLLRLLALRITWDGQKAPAVWAPFGDFFGVGAGAVPHENLPSGLAKDGVWYSHWYMPFGSHATIAVDNDSGQPVKMKWEVVHAPLDRPIASLLRFHAKWHRDAFLPGRSDRAPDWTLLNTQGTGRYVGTQLHVWNPVGGWWGEGDEKFFIDGEKFPSTFGTGTEDYFGYAWCSSQTFVRAFHSQTANEDNCGHASVNRWHIADDVPFQSSFEGCMEKYPRNNGQQRDDLPPSTYADTVFWYLSADGTDPYAPAPVSQRIGYWVPQPVYHEPDAIEGEYLKAVGKPHPSTHRGRMYSFGPFWSGDMVLTWEPSVVGEKVELELPAATSGKFQVVARFTKSIESGVFQLSMDGQHLGQPVDLYNPKLQAAEPLSLGIVELTEGKHLLGVELTGKNPVANNSSLGLDYIKLIPVR